MRDATPGMIATLQSNAPTLTICAQITRRDGEIKTFTAFNRDLEIDIGDGNGPLIYRSEFGIARTAIRSEARLNVDGGQVEGLLATITSDGITEQDLRAGYYDFAAFRWFLVDWANLANGIIRLPGDRIGRVSPGRGDYRAEVRGILQRLQQTLGKLYSGKCSEDLGGEICRVKLDPPAWLAATPATVRPPLDAALGSVIKPSTYNGRHFECVTAGTTGAIEPAWDTTLGNLTNDNGVEWRAIQALTAADMVVDTIADPFREFTVLTLADAPDDLFTLGRATFGAGAANENIAREIKRWTLSTYTVELALPLPFEIQLGDPLIVAAGCTKLLPACRDTFNNTLNRQGYDYIPGNDKLFRTPDAA